MEISPVIVRPLGGRQSRMAGIGRAGMMERRLNRRAMEHTGGNKTKAAQFLELSYPALLGKLKEYGC